MNYGTKTSHRTEPAISTQALEQACEAYWNAGKVVPRWRDEDEDQREVVRIRMREALGVYGKADMLREREIWFAWRPVRLTSGKWAWWRLIERTRRAPINVHAGWEYRDL